MSEITKSTSNYNELPIRFTYNGFNFKQIDRIDNIAIYEQSKPAIDAPIYEVVKIKKKTYGKLSPLAGQQYSAYPTSSEWGLYGWSYINLAKAQEKFSELVEKQDRSVLVN